MSLISTFIKQVSELKWTIINWGNFYVIAIFQSTKLIIKFQIRLILKIEFFLSLQPMNQIIFTTNQKDNESQDI